MKIYKVSIKPESWRETVTLRFNDRPGVSAIIAAIQTWIDEYENARDNPDSDELDRDVAGDKVREYGEIIELLQAARGIELPFDVNRITVAGTAVGVIMFDAGEEVFAA